MTLFKSILLIAILLSSSCEKFVSSTDDDYFSLQSKDKKFEEVKVIFSHNINGETHPCGCRKFPLGGLVQVSSYLYDLSKKSPIYYVDSGDMLFPSTTIPKSLEKSIHFTASKIIEAQNLLSLKLFTPGDQDFSAGINYLEKVSKESKFDFLISNLNKNIPIKHKEFKEVKLGKRQILFFGILNPSLMGENSHLFSDPIKSLKRIIEKFKETKNKTIIVLSHSGLDFDKKLASKIPSIDFIIGSHSQSFTKESIVIGKTQIAQVLSRNHYLGELTVPLAPEKEITFKLVSMSDEKKDLWKKNPMNDWLASYKSQLDKIQVEESKQMDMNFSEDNKAPTYATCLECHKPQTEFWQSTAHATSFHTLIKEKASNNPSCIGCHSLKFQDPAGFSSKNTIVRTDKNVKLDTDAYWKDIESAFKGVESIRSLKSSKRVALAQNWHKIDQKHRIQYNNANVQCLNCHDKAFDHPFTMNEKKAGKIENACYKCHTPDQSPSWYKGEDGAQSEKFNSQIIKDKLKQIACPLNK